MPDPAVTIRHVAAAAGVHPATASRALNPETRILVSDKTARRVLKVAKSLGYHPNPMARTLRTRRSHTVGVLIPDLTNPLFPPIIRGLEDRLAEAGYVALIGNTDSDDRRERLVFEQMRARRVDGFVMATARLRDPLLAEAAREEIPVVLVNRVTDSHRFPAVSADNELGSRLVVSHLVALGHRRIAHIAGPQDVSTGPSRLRGFLAGMAAGGLDADPELIVYASAFSIQEGLRCCRELLGKHGSRGPARSPSRASAWTAVVAANDMLAVGAYSALDEAGLRCPDDVSVAGFNDMPFIDRLCPPLTSVRFPHYQVGTEAARLLLEQIAGPSAQASGTAASEASHDGGGTGEDRTGESGAGAAKILFLAPELIVRGSTAQAARARSRRAASAVFRDDAAERVR
jgi:LacI family transcriptional regulator, galactose operon repressor